MSNLTTETKTTETKTPKTEAEESTAEQTITGDVLVARAAAIESAPLASIVLPAKVGNAWLTRRKVGRLNSALAAMLPPKAPKAS